MKGNIITLSIFILLLFACHSQVNKGEKKEKVLFNIYFADGFNFDEIELAVNDRKIIKAKLESDKSDGLTDMMFQVIKKGDDIYLIDLYTNKKKYDLGISQKIKLSILCKEKWSEFILDQSFGKYIVVELRNDAIYFDQKKKKPLFD